MTPNAAGAGKTKLVSNVIDHIQANLSRKQNDEALAYFYCVRSEAVKHDISAIICNFAKQLSVSRSDNKIQNLAVEAYERFEKKGFETTHACLDEGLSLLHAFVDIYPHTTFVLDALDECDPKTRLKVFEVFDDLLTNSANPVKIPVSSRAESDIRDRFQEGPNVQIEATDNQEDIVSFVKEQITLNRSWCNSVPLDIQEKVVECLHKKSEGMFQWAALQIDQLLALRRARDIEERLGKLPKSLHAAYKEIYDDIRNQPGSSGIIAERAIQWLICAREPLNECLLPMVSCQDPGNGLVRDIDVSAEFLLSVCRNLVVLDQHSGFFRFAHLSVQEFFESVWTWSDVNILVSKVCLNVLLDHSMLLVDSEHQSLRHRLILRAPPQRTQSRFSTYNIKSCQTNKPHYDGSKHDLEMCFLADSCGRSHGYCSICGLVDDIWPENNINSEIQTHVALDNEYSIRANLGTEDDYNFEKANADLKQERTRAQSAGVEPSHSVVSRIYNRYWNGIYDRRSGLECSKSIAPLSRYAHLNWYLHCNDKSETDVDQSLFDLVVRFFGHPTGDSVFYHTWHSKLVYSKDMFRETKDYPRSPLSGACQLGFHKVLLRWRSEGLDLANFRDERDITMLGYATSQGFHAAMKLLLQSGADPNELGKSPNGLNKYSMNPLSIAMKTRNVETMQLLLDFGANINEIAWSDYMHSELLWNWISPSNLSVLQCLLDAGLETHKQNDLLAAAIWHYDYRFQPTTIELIRLLLSSNADPNSSKGVRKVSPAYSLFELIQGGQIEAVELFLEFGATTIWPEGHISSVWGSALHLAVSEQQTQICLLLCKEKLIVQARDSEGKTPLHLTAKLTDPKTDYEGTTVNEWFQKRGLVQWCAPKGQADATFWTPRFLCRMLIKTFVSLGADPNAIDNDSLTPLHYASELGNLVVAEVLVELGSDTNVQDTGGQFPLQSAREKNY